MSTDLVPQEQMSVTLFGTDNPAEVVSRAAVVATALADLVRKQNLIVRIGQSDHVRVEGWTLLGSMLGVFPVVEWTRQVLRDEQPFGWEARVEARTRAGEIVGAAEAECLRDENPWSFAPVNKYGKASPPRDDYALRSMAQTRAVSKALRLPLGFVMQLAGFDPTPAEEMPRYPTVDMSDPGIPFGDAPVPEHQPPRYISEKQRTRLWTLAEKAGVDEPALRLIVQAQTGQESTKKIKAGREYDAVVAALGSSGEPNEQASGHEQPAQATNVTPSEVVSPAASGGEPASPDDMSAPGVAATPTSSGASPVGNDGDTGADISQLTARLVASSSKPQEAAYAIEMHAKDHTPSEHHGWLMAQERKRFSGGDAA
jgi:hypothetical protein